KFAPSPHATSSTCPQARENSSLRRRPISNFSSIPVLVRYMDESGNESVRGVTMVSAVMSAPMHLYGVQVRCIVHRLPVRCTLVNTCVRQRPTHQPNAHP